jgi:hypothetical protein
MADVVSLTHTFGGLSSPVPLNYLDANYTDITDAIASLNTFSNYLVDTGAANAYIVTLGAGLTCSLAAGLLVQVKIANTNTTSSTINVNGTGAKNIYLRGAALVGGELIGGEIYVFMYDGTQYQLLGNANASGTQASTFTFDGSGGTTGSVTMTYQKVGNFVTLNLPAIFTTSGTGSVALNGDTALPAAIRPSATQYQSSIPARNNGVALATPGIISVASTGIVTINRDAAGTAFTNASSCGLQGPTTFTYFIG